MGLINVLALMYFFLPAYFANVFPVLCRNVLKPFARPIDGGKTFRKKPVFGSNKTWRGLLVGIVAAILLFSLQKILYIGGFLHPLALFDYSTMSISLGFLLGFGTILGDLVESFFKRQIGIAPGKPWYIIDQIDYVLGALVVCSPIFFLGYKDSLLLITISFVLTVLVNHLGYLLKIRKVKW